ncbi:MAG: LysR family transcriptional regulator [Zoogloeaceae bacterium]|nr:LysR family transcriptional regulator [Zoogloeaceae bacterium]
MTDRFEAMQLFVAVADAGSFSAAASGLDIPLATVSRKVAELEGHLGARLLLRSTRRLTLTEAGQSYLAACRRILEQVGEAERTVSGEFTLPQGELVVTAPIVFGRLHVVPVVVEFLRAYPAIDVRLVLADHLVRLLDDQVDVALRIGELPDSGLVALRVGAIRRVICASPDYLARRGTPVQPEQLAGHDCVAFEGLGGTRRWNFRVSGAELPIAIHTRLAVNTAEAAVDAAIAGLGLTRVLCYQMAAAERAGDLRIVLAPFEEAPWPVSLVHGGQGPLPLKLRAFLDFARPRLAARLEASLA